MAQRGDVRPLLDLTCLMPDWKASQTQVYIPFRQKGEAQASYILSASSSAITSFFLEESRHLTSYFLVAPYIKPVHFNKVPTWLKLTTSQLVFELQMSFGEGLQVGKHYSQYLKNVPRSNWLLEKQKIFHSSELTIHIRNECLMCSIHPHFAVQENVKGRCVT